MKKLKEQSETKKSSVGEQGETVKKKNIVDPKEHEEDQSTNIRMKPQPLDKKKKN